MEGLHSTVWLPLCYNRVEIYKKVQRFRGGLVFKAHRLVYHSTPGWRVIKKKKEG